MRVTVLQENLLKSLHRVSRIVPTKPQVSILQNALLTTDEGRLKIIVSNLETTECTWVPSKVEKPGQLCVPAKVLTELIASLPPETIDLSVEDGSLKIIGGTATATIPGISAEEFPASIPTGIKKEGAIEKASLIEAMQQTLFSAAIDETRPILMGVYIQTEEQKTTVVTTDGYRLSVKKLNAPVSLTSGLVLPARALSEIVKICQEEKNIETIYVSEVENGQIFFSCGDTEILTRKIDGEYPKYEKIIPTKHSISCSISTESLRRAVKSAAIFARDSANIVRFKIQPGTVTVSANTPEVGENNVVVEAQTQGEEGTIAFNSRFLLDFLSTVSGETLLFKMTGAINPGVFQIENDESYLHIIMPVRVQE